MKVSLETVSNILDLLKNDTEFCEVLDNCDPQLLDSDPWKSNFRVTSPKENKNLCEKISELLSEECGQPLYVAIMRTVDDPDELIKPFHPIHMDTRPSNKTLLVLKGDGDYDIFAKTERRDFSWLQRAYLDLILVPLFLIEKLKLGFLQGCLSHRLPNSISKKVYESSIYKSNVTGELIKFNNMLPHHSHPTKTKFSVLLQVVYS